MKLGWAVAAGAALALALACGSAIPTASHSVAPRVVGVQGRPSDLRAQIETLDADITSRLDAVAAAPASPDEIAAARPMTMDAIAKVCTPPAPPTATCTDVCKLGDSICDDATRICGLADQLPGDGWAADKCAGGKASCERSRQRCCDCR